jgi:hypothetical protein
MTLLNPSRKIGWASTNNIRMGFGDGILHFQIKLGYLSLNYASVHAIEVSVVRDRISRSVS